MTEIYRISGGIFSVLQEKETLQIAILCKRWRCSHATVQSRSQNTQALFQRPISKVPWNLYFLFHQKTQIAVQTVVIGKKVFAASVVCAEVKC